MTKIFNNPSEFAEEALAGFCDIHSGLVRQVPGGAVRRHRPAKPKVAVLAGGGSGHYPAFAGLIGTGLADGAVVGNIFTSPSAQQAYAVAKSADSGAGVVFTYGNYAGDVMNFGMASERLAAEGIQVENVLVTDDIASAPPSESEKRRGIAGDFTVFKIMGAAAEAGADLADVVRLGKKANSLTRTIGSAFHGCTFPGADAPLFTLKDKQMGLGLGIHGEPGLFDTGLPSAKELGQEFVSRLLAETPPSAGDRLAVILNGLGSTKHEELFVLWLTVAPLLRDAGYTLVMPEVGELVTSLDMSGVSLTITWLDAELEPLWTAPAETPAYRRGTAAVQPGDASGEETSDAGIADAPFEADGDSRTYAVQCVAALEAARESLHAAESRLGDLDAVAGDGDHGRGMVRGIDAAATAGAAAGIRGAGAGSVLIAAGDAWADKAGGTSGVLWGAGLRALGESLGNQRTPGAEELAAGMSAFAARITDLGKAAPGDKTMVDALLPFTEALTRLVQEGAEPRQAWASAAHDAVVAAEATAALRPLKGRARPLAEKSVGTPGPRSNIPRHDFHGHGTVPGRFGPARLQRSRHHVQPDRRSTFMTTEPATATPATTGLRLVLGADEAGVDYKNRILADLQADPRISEIIDIGVNRSDAPEDFTRPYVGIAAGELIRDGHADRAILFCGTGIGVAIAANKVDGIRATTAHDSFSVERSVLSNDCQVLTMGQRVVGVELASRLAREWIGYTFDPSSASADKVKVLTDFEGC